jgi:hypothetical protein
MKSNGKLQKHYDKLTPRERLALILGAIERGDETERAALVDTAPHWTYRLPHHQNLYDVLQLLALSHLVNQLQRALTISTLAHVGENDNMPYRGACIAAYVFCVQADTWRAFCDELGIGENAIIAEFKDALAALEFAEEIARAIAYTFDEAQAAMQRVIGSDADALITIERSLQELRGLFNKHAG